MGEIPSIAAYKMSSNSACAATLCGHENKKGRDKACILSPSEQQKENIATHHVSETKIAPRT